MDVADTFNLSFKTSLARPCEDSRSFYARYRMRLVSALRIAVQVSSNSLVKKYKSSRKQRAICDPGLEIASITGLATHMTITCLISSEEGLDRKSTSIEDFFRNLLSARAGIETIPVQQGEILRICGVQFMAYLVGRFLFQ